jgi:hypothetical protein
MAEKMEMQAIDPRFRWPWPGPWPLPEPGDPGPVWEMIIDRLDRTQLNRVAGIQLQVTQAALKAQKLVLDAKLEAVTQLQEIMKAGVK